MKGEKIVYANDTDIAIEGITRIIEEFGSRDGHKLVGTAKNLDEVRALFERDQKPTVFILDPRFPDLLGGEKAIKLVRKLSPETTVVTISAIERLRLGDYNLVPYLRAEELVDFLTDLQH